MLLPDRTVISAREAFAGWDSPEPVTNEMRARALRFVLQRVAAKVGADVTSADFFVRARACGLDPKMYELCWKILEWASR
jgi:hypothetical protein